MTKSQYYIRRLLREKPPTTKGGLKYQIHKKGEYLTTESGGTYVPCDYPRLFGWGKISEGWHPFYPTWTYVPSKRRWWQRLAWWRKPPSGLVTPVGHLKIKGRAVHINIRVKINDK